MATTITRYVNTAASAGGDGTTNGTGGANRAYASLAECIADELVARPNLVSNDELLHILCCGTSADTTFPQIEGFTTDATRYIHVEGNSGDAAGAHYSTVWSTSHYRVSVSAQFTYAFLNRTPYFRMTQIQIENTHATEGYSAFRHEPEVSASSDNAFITGVNCRGAQWINFGNGFNHRDGKVTYRNCWASDNQKGFEVGFGPDGPPEAHYQNCVSVGNTAFGWWTEAGSITYDLTNCYAGGNGDTDYFDDGNDYTRTTCASEDGSMGSTVAYSTSSGAYFTNVGAGTEDVSIGSSSSLKDAGTDLSGSFTIDIQNQTRTGSWDIGVDELASGPRFILGSH